MNSKKLIITSLLLGIIAVLFVVLQKKESVDSRVQTVILPDAISTQIKKITLEAKNEKTDLAVDNSGNWSVFNNDNLPADAKKIQNLIRDLGTAKIGGLVSRNKAKIEEFGFDKGTTLTLSGDSDKELLKATFVQSQNNSQTWYVRFGDEEKVYSATSISLSSSKSSWLLKKLMYFESKDVQKLSLTSSLPDKTYTFTRDASGMLQIDNLEEGKITKQSEVDNLLSGISGIEFSQAVPKNHEDAAKALASPDSVRIEVNTGLIYQFELGMLEKEKDQKKYYLTLSEVGGRSEALKQVSFEIPQYRAEKIFKERKDYLEDKPKENPAQAAAVTPVIEPSQNEQKNESP